MMIIIMLFSFLYRWFYCEGVCMYVFHSVMTYVYVHPPLLAAKTTTVVLTTGIVRKPEQVICLLFFFFFSFLI